NSYAYFYPFILAPVMIPVAVALSRLRSAVSGRLTPYLALSLLLVGSLATSISVHREVLENQRQTLSAVTYIFPAQVSYFDSSGMVSQFPKANFFMSTWGMASYLDGDYPTFRESLANATVPLLITDREPLIENQTGVAPSHRLLPDDGQALRSSFIH